jgi:hypothetical protein
MTIAEQKQTLEKLQRQFDIAHAEIKSKLETAKTEKNFKQVITLLNEERELVKRNSEKMLELMAEARS